MDLNEFEENLLNNLSCKDLDELQSYVFKSITDEEMFKHLMEVLKLLKTDDEEFSLQRFYQFYLARKEEFSQDFTSVSLAKLLANFINTDGKVLDICGGFGQLTIQHNNNSEYDNYYVIEELDDNIIPWLLVNLAFHNVRATVKHMNALTRVEKGNYAVEKGMEFGSVSKLETNVNYPSDDIKGVLSNPPFDDYNNYNFVLQGLYSSSNDAKLSFILPKKVLTNSSEKYYRKELVDKSYLKAVILCSRGMFESTNIPVTILYLDKCNKTNNVSFIDASDFYDYGDGIENIDGEIKNEVYDKKLIIFNDKQIERICDCIENEINSNKFSKTVNTDDIKANDYNLNPKLYV